MESAGRPGTEEPKRERQRPRESTAGLERAPEAQEERRPRGGKEGNERFVKRKDNLTLCCYEEVEGVRCG